MLLYTNRPPCRSANCLKFSRQHLTVLQSATFSMQQGRLRQYFSRKQFYNGQLRWRIVFLYLQIFWSFMSGVQNTICIYQRMQKQLQLISKHANNNVQRFLHTVDFVIARKKFQAVVVALSTAQLLLIPETSGQNPFISKFY